MKIKEVENRVGMTRANIRYYEKEGLLNTTIRNENNYREYTEADVEQLQRIKILRLLGVAPADIKLLNADAISMEEIMQKRMKELEREAKEIQDIQKICETIIDKRIDVHSLNENVLTGDRAVWAQRLEEILNRDIVNEIITRRQLNTHIASMLVWGYLINVIVTLFYGTFLINQDRAVLELSSPFGSGTYGIHSLETSYLFFVYVVIAVVCGIGIHWTANVKSQLVIFHISALVTSPMIIELSRMLGNGNVQLLKNFTGGQLSVFWFMIIIYVIILYALSVKWEKMFTKVRYTLGIAALFFIIYTCFAYLATMSMLVPVIAFATMLIYIGLVWTIANMDRQRYNRYWAVVASCKIMNIIGTLFGQQGRGRASAWLK